MCHFGNPFLESAAAVVEKNPNVATDLSGLLEGRVDLDEYFRVQAGYAGLLRTWLTAICQWDDVMYGTDWPIVNLAEYRDDYLYTMRRFLKIPRRTGGLTIYQIMLYCK